MRPAFMNVEYYFAIDSYEVITVNYANFVHLIKTFNDLIVNAYYYSNNRENYKKYAFEMGLYY